MSTHHLSPHEWQTLSEYLDGQLSNRELQEVEARLQARVEFRMALEELRQTRTLLRSLPKRRAPRNFTLTPAMVESMGGKPPKPRGAYPFFRLASALASFLLVMTFLGDLAIGATIRNLAASRSAAPMAAESADQGSPAQPDATGLSQHTLPTEEVAPTMGEEALNQSYPVPAAGPEGQAPTETPQVEAFMAVPQEPELDPTIIARMTEAPAGMGGGEVAAPTPNSAGAAGAGPTEDPSMYLKVAPTPFPQATPEPGLVLDAPSPAPQARMLVPSPEPTLLPEALPAPMAGDQAERNADYTGDPARGVSDPRSVLRPIEWVLGIIAVLTGLAALYWRSKPDL
jgi:anti-sigma factor RsiW